MSDWQNRIVGYTTRPAAELTGNPRNPRRHPQRQRNAVKGSLDTLGWIAPVIENVRTGYLIDGHERVMQALGLGDDTPIPVIQVDLAEHEEAQALATFDFITYMAEYDRENLDALLREVNSDNNDIQSLLAEMATEFDIVTDPEPQEAPEAQIDRAEELLQKWNVQRGDLWIIGEHRLLCGDSTSAEDVARVMGGENCNLINTDPPYGVNYSGQNTTMYYGKNKNGKSRSAIEFDSTPEEAFPTIKAALSLVSSDCLFLWHAPQYHTEVKYTLPVHYSIFAVIVWNKNHANFGAMGATYKPKYEMAIAAKVDRIPFYGANNETTVWDIDRNAKNEYHPTEKPTELFQRVIKNHTQSSETVYDPFGGSGTTMVACQQLQRKCRMIEIEPKYCAVILERMSQMGLTPEKAHGETRTEN